MFPTTFIILVGFVGSALTIYEFIKTRIGNSPKRSQIRAFVFGAVTIALVLVSIIFANVLSPLSGSGITPTQNINTPQVGTGNTPTPTSNTPQSGTGVTPTPTHVSPTQVPSQIPSPTAPPPKAISYPPAGWTVALSDPLSTPGNWQNGSDPSSGSSCQFSGGTYRIQAKNLNYFCTGPAPVFSDLAFEVNMTIIQGSCGGIWFRGNFSVGAPAYFFQVCQDQRYILFLYGRSGIQTLLSNTSPAIHAGLNQSNLIAVVTIGNHFDLYINQQKIDSTSDSTLSSGQINIAAVGGNNLTEVVFRDAKVWTP